MAEAESFVDELGVRAVNTAQVEDKVLQQVRSVHTTLFQPPMFVHEMGGLSVQASAQNQAVESADAGAAILTDTMSTLMLVLL